MTLNKQRIMIRVIFIVLLKNEKSVEKYQRKEDNDCLWERIMLRSWWALRSDVSRSIYILYKTKREKMINAIMITFNINLVSLIAFIKGNNQNQTHQHLCNKIIFLGFALDYFVCLHSLGQFFRNVNKRISKSWKYQKPSSLSFQKIVLQL